MGPQPLGLGPAEDGGKQQQLHDEPQDVLEAVLQEATRGHAVLENNTWARDTEARPLPKHQRWFRAETSETPGDARGRPEASLVLVCYSLYACMSKYKKGERHCIAHNNPCVFFHTRVADKITNECKHNAPSP